MPIVPIALNDFMFMNTLRHTMGGRMVRNCGCPECRPPVLYVDSAVARARARALLQELISAEDWRHYEATKQVRVTGSAGGRYVLERHSFQGNVRQIVDRHGNVSGRNLCAHIAIHDDQHGLSVPVECNLIAQLLAIRTNELGFLNVANDY